MAVATSVLAKGNSSHDNLSVRNDLCSAEGLVNIKKQSVPSVNGLRFATGSLELTAAGIWNDCSTCVLPPISSTLLGVGFPLELIVDLKTCPPGQHSFDCGFTDAQLIP